MATISNVYFKKDILLSILKTIEKGVNVTIVINDECNQYNQNVTAYLSQTQEDRKNKTPKIYIGNGSVVFTDGEINIAPKRSDSKDIKF